MFFLLCVRECVCVCVEERGGEGEGGLTCAGALAEADFLGRERSSHTHKKKAAAAAQRAQIEDAASLAREMQDSSFRFAVLRVKRPSFFAICCKLLSLF
jgi:pyridoxine/pyridoxamine 5'-phosphate oxidase